ncbi:AEC family transporter [Castellaniella sp.]|uniref:AEC family transporter n=1 Tax=Castellaniella sp. TaxID=1955812 RepID=UPI003C7663C6
MLLTLLNIVLPVFAVAALGYVFGRRQVRPPDMGFINHANVMVFCPALVFSALLDNPVDLAQGWPLVAAGVLIIIVPGLLLACMRCRGVSRTAFLVPGMFRNTGNIGIPLMMLAYGKGLLGDIVVLFVLSNLLQFSLGLFLLSRGRNRWLWLRNPNIWAAVLGVVLAPHRDWIPAFVTTSIDLTGQIAIPLMLFALGVRLSQDRIEKLGLALRINALYLLAGLLTLPFVLWLLPLTPEWARLVALSVMLPPAVLNYLLSEQYGVEPKTVASVVLLGNLLSVGVIPLVVWATLTWI